MTEISSYPSSGSSLGKKVPSTGKLLPSDPVRVVNIKLLNLGAVNLSPLVIVVMLELWLAHLDLNVLHVT